MPNLSKYNHNPFVFLQKKITKHVQRKRKKQKLLATERTHSRHLLGDRIPQAHHSLVSPLSLMMILLPIRFIIDRSYRERLPAEPTRTKSEKREQDTSRQPNRASLLTANSWWWYRINSYDRPFLLGQVSDIGAVQGLRSNRNQRINLMLFCFRCKAAIGFLLFEECRRRAIYDMQ